MSVTIKHIYNLHWIQMNVLNWTKVKISFNFIICIKEKNLCISESYVDSVLEQMNVDLVIQVCNTRSTICLLQILKHIIPLSFHLKKKKTVICSINLPSIMHQKMLHLIISRSFLMISMVPIEKKNFLFRFQINIIFFFFWYAVKM